MERDIPIGADEQQALLNEAKEFAGAGSLIPAEMSYRDQLNRFKAQTARAGIDRVHGLRHHCAQTRYAELTGWKAPAAGGPVGFPFSDSALNNVFSPSSARRATAAMPCALATWRNARSSAAGSSISAICRVFQ